MDAVEKGKHCFTGGDIKLISLSSVVTVPTALSTTKNVYDLESTTSELKILLLLLSEHS